MRDISRSLTARFRLPSLIVLILPMSARYRKCFGVTPMWAAASVNGHGFPAGRPVGAVVTTL
jgi:hypothetical protein